jgi:TRAP-type C4-dicarboxylate transport system permease small subunit
VEKAYGLWRRFQDRILEPFATVILLGCTLLALLEIVRRYVFGVSFEWQSDAVTFFMLSAVYLYFSISQRRNEHLTVTIITESLETLGPRSRRVAEAVKLVAAIISCVFLILLAWWGIPEVQESIKYETRTESLAFPMWPFLAIFVAGLAFMAITLTFQIYRTVQRLRGVTVLEEPQEEVPAVHSGVL